MVTEKEQDPSKKEKKGKKESIFDVVSAKIIQLLAKIEELTSLKQQGQKLDIKQERVLKQSEQELQKRTIAFYETTYGKRIQKLKEDIETKLQGNLDRVSQTDDEQKLVQILTDTKAYDAAVRLLDAQEQRILSVDELPVFGGLARWILSTTIEEYDAQIKEEIETKYNRSKLLELETKAAQQRPKMAGELPRSVTGEDVEANMEMYGYSKAAIEAAKARAANMDPYDRHFSQEVEDAITSGNVQALWDQFNELMAIVDSLPQINFHEALDFNTQIKLARLRGLILKMPDNIGRTTLNQFMLESKMRMMLHNSVWMVEQGAGKPEQFQQTMEMFNPELFDQIFTHEGASLAAHLYENGLEIFRSRNNNYAAYELLVPNPHNEGKSELDDWVRNNFMNIIKAQYRQSEKFASEEEINAEFKDKWPENKIRLTLALGKGYEVTTLRFPELVARGRLPLDYEGHALASPWGEDFVRPLDPNEALMEKFLTGDPSGMWLMFAITGEEIHTGSSRAQIEECLKKKTGVDPKSLRLIDAVNFLQIGGPFTQSSWRGIVGMEGLTEEQKKDMGLVFRLADLDHRYQYHEKDKRKAIDSGENLAYWQERRDIFKESLNYNPVRLFLEAEMQDGEILDPSVRSKVILTVLEETGSAEDKEQAKTKYALEKKPQENDEAYQKRLQSEDIKKNRNEFCRQAEEDLMMLTQVAVAKKRKELDFSLLPEGRRQQAEAYYKAIKKVVTTEEREYRDRNNRLVKGTLLEFVIQKQHPYLPGTEDAYWEDMQFIKMGQKGFSRRMRDYMGAYKAMTEMVNLQNNFAMCRKPEDFAGVLNKFWLAVREYDKPKASKLVSSLVEAIARFNAGNFGRRYMPEPFGFLVTWGGNWWGSESYAKKAFGNPAPAWRAVDARHFLSQARVLGLIGIEQERQLRKDLGGQVFDLVIEAVSRYTPLFLALVLYAWLKELVTQLQETTKEH